MYEIFTYVVMFGVVLLGAWFNYYLGGGLADSATKMPSFTQRLLYICFLPGILVVTMLGNLGDIAKEGIGNTIIIFIAGLAGVNASIKRCK